MRKREFGALVLEAAAEMPRHRDELCKLDMGIGDGDHGVTVERGFLAVQRQFGGDPGDGGGAFYQRMGDVLSASMGGAIGPVYGLYFSGLGALGTADEVTAATLADAMESAAGKVMRAARVTPGEKTIVDAMLPACEAMRQAVDGTLPDALTAAARAAELGAQRTVNMKATKGRARFLQEKSVGYRDAGASSFVLYMEALANAVTRAEKE